MLHASTQKLIIKLCELTALGDIQWREGRDGAVVFETEGYAVEIDGQPAKLRVLNAEGNALEHVDTDMLSAAQWPGGDGSFADHVSTMATQAKRLARGTDQAISRILSSLSAPAAPPSFQSATPQEHALAATAGPESDAAMAAAVADMAIRLHWAPHEDPSEALALHADKPSEEALSEAMNEPAPVSAEAKTEPAETMVEGSAQPPTPRPEATPPPAARAAPAEHFKRSSETFGRTRSFAISGRTHHRPSPEARPVSSLGKITASGLIVPGRLSPAKSDVETAQAEPEAIIPAPPAPEEAKAAAPRATPAPTSPDAYKPWA